MDHEVDRDLVCISSPLDQSARNVADVSLFYLTTFCSIPVLFIRVLSSYKYRQKA